MTERKQQILEVAQELLSRAAAIKGMRTSAFIREIALEKAQQVIKDAENRAEAISVGSKKLLWFLGKVFCC